MVAIYLISLIGLAISFFKDRQKTVKALTLAQKKFINMLPHFFLMICLISVSLFFIPDTLIMEYLGPKNQWHSMIIASLLGSIVVMPGFIAFPLAEILVSKGISYMAIAAFTTTLMLVGVLSYPIEKKFLGAKMAIIRNLVSYVVAILVSLVIGALYGEI